MTDSQLIGGDQDENGGITAGGYRWCETKNKCIRSWDENCPSIDARKWLCRYKCLKRLGAPKSAINKALKNSKLF